MQSPSPAMLRRLEVSAMDDVCGIYKIENMVNGKVYIGQSKNVYKRFSQHRAKLNSGTHCGRHLQFAWNQYGEECFDFALIEECRQDELDDREIYWIEKYDSFTHGYNATVGGGGKRGWKTPKEVVLKRTGANNVAARKVVCLNTGKIYDCIADAAQDYGLERSLITMCCKGKVKSCGGKCTGVKTVWAYYEDYLTMDEQEIAHRIMAEHKKPAPYIRRDPNGQHGYIPQPRPVECVTTGNIYGSTKIAAETLGICEASIWKCCHGQRNYAGGMEWRYYTQDERTVA